MIIAIKDLPPLGAASIPHACLRRGSVFAVCALVASLGSTRAISAEQPTLEEVIVTAERRVESLQDTPISIVALGADELEVLSITDIDDLGSNVPNFKTTPHPNSASTPRIFIRGVGNYDDQITQDPSVAVYLDNVYIGRTQGMGMSVADLQRIEVLRGPQGTLYGRNATGGAVNFITVPPSLTSTEFSQQLTFGVRNQFLSKSMINVPITEKLAFKGYYLHTEEDGFVDNFGAGAPRYGDKDRDAARVDIKWLPSRDVDVRYAYDWSSIGDTPDYLMPSTLGVKSHRPSRSHAGSQVIKPVDVETMGHQLTIAWAIGPDVTLKSLSSYRSIDSFVYQDYLSGTGRPATPFFVDAWVDQDQLSQEFQLLGTTLDDRIDYTVGIYYFQEEGDGKTLNWLPGFGIRQYALAEIDNTAMAVYGQLGYTPDVLDKRLHLTLGARWSKDERKARLVRNTQLIAIDSVIPGSDQLGNGKASFYDITPSFVVSYDVTDAINIYAKIGEGYKTGGFNVRASTIEFFEKGFGEETLTSYEVGIKAEWFNRRLRTNAAVFESDYEDIQINAQTVLDDPSKADILNAGGATIRGFEFDATVAVSQSLTMNLNYGYLDAKYDEIKDGLGRDVTNNYEFVNAPKSSFRYSVSWDIASTSYGDLKAHLNYTWTDDRFITASNLNGKYIIDSYDLLDARIAIDDLGRFAAGSLRSAIWVKNLTDEEYPYLNGPAFGGITAWGAPKSYGIDFIYNY